MLDQKQAKLICDEHNIRSVPENEEGIDLLEYNNPELLEAYSALHRLATGSDMQITATDAWDEDDGYCLFFHFENFREPPEVRCATPLEIGFDPAYWNYFSPLNFNGALEQAEKLHTEQNSPSLPTNKTT